MGEIEERQVQYQVSWKLQQFRGCLLGQFKRRMMRAWRRVLVPQVGLCNGTHQAISGGPISLYNSESHEEAFILFSISLGIVKKVTIPKNCS